MLFVLVFSLICGANIGRNVYFSATCVELSIGVRLGRGVTTELPMGDSHARPLPHLPYNAM